MNIVTYIAMNLVIGIFQDDKSMDIGKNYVSFGTLNDVFVFRFHCYANGSVSRLNVIHVE